MSEKHIGVDFDATLATYDGWKGVGVLGDPIYPMVERVKAWIEAGKTVKIFTARVANENLRERLEEVNAISAWCREHIGQALEVTCVKDQWMEEYWDDRAVRVVPNTGCISDGRDVQEPSVEAGDIGALM